MEMKRQSKPCEQPGFTIITALSAMLLVTGCDINDSNTKSTTSTTSTLSTSDLITGIGYSLPERLLKSGKMTVGVVPQFQPMAFYPEGTGALSGADIEIMEAIAQNLGLTVDWAPVSFDAMLTGIISRRFDASITGISDTPERQGQIKFVDYMMESKIYLILAENANAVSEELTSVCGLTIAVQRGTMDPKYLQILNDGCAAEGRPDARSLELSSSSDKKLAVQSRRAEVSFFSSIDFPALQKESGNAFAAYRVRNLPAEIWGIALHPNDTELARAVQQTVQELMDNGTYTSILEKWNISHLSLETATINAGK
jgi:polar amino acid transport system substrate-binding protein